VPFLLPLCPTYQGLHCTFLPCEQSWLGVLHGSLYSLPPRSVRLPARQRMLLPPHSSTLGSPSPSSPHADNHAIPIAPHKKPLQPKGNCVGLCPCHFSCAPNTSLHHEATSCSHEAATCTITGHRTIPTALVQDHMHPNSFPAQDTTLPINVPSCSPYVNNHSIPRNPTKNTSPSSKVWLSPVRLLSRLSTLQSTRCCQQSPSSVPHLNQCPIPTRGCSGHLPTPREPHTGLRHSPYSVSETGSLFPKAPSSHMRLSPL
jgi:hypothetical protein